MAKMYLKPNTNLADVVTMKAADPSLEVVSTTGKPLSLQRIASLAFNPEQSTAGIANANAQLANILDQVNSSPTPLSVTPSANSINALQSAANQATVVPYSSSVLPSVSAGNNFTGMSSNLGAQQVTLSPSSLAQTVAPYPTNDWGDPYQTLAPSANAQSLSPNDTMDASGWTAEPPAPKAKSDAELLATNWTSADIDSGAITPAELSRLRDLNTQTINANAAKNPQPQVLGIQDTPAELTAAQKAAAIAAANTTNTKVTGDTLATLGGTGTVTDANKINTQGNEGGVTLTNVDGNVNNTLATKPVDALTTSPVTGLATSQISTLDTKPISTLDTKPISTLDTKPISTLDTKPIATLPTAGTQALTTADLATWGKTLPQGITADQLKTALEGQQTALTSQNANFLKDWNISADALKTNILSGVDTKNQQFGTQATQGFMDAFKNFQIPTNQQTGVNLGNYNDNRNAAADQWWSQYVTGRR